MQQLEQKLIKAAESYDVVAFDVFDTLLFRDTGSPSDLFVLMEQIGLAPQGFARKRREAEAMARTAGQEVTLAEIYDQPPLQGIDPIAEFEAELRVAVPNRLLLRTAKLFTSRGKCCMPFLICTFPPNRSRPCWNNAALIFSTVFTFLRNMGYRNVPENYSACFLRKTI